MAFGAQKIFPIDTKPGTAVGVAIPFDAPGVFYSTYTTQAAVKNNLLNFFLTNPGERLLNPTFGGGIRNFIFEQIYNDNIEFLLEDISLKVRNYFPNIQIEDLNVSRNENNNEISINFTYKVINTNIQDEINISFT